MELVNRESSWKLGQYNYSFGRGEARFSSCGTIVLPTEVIDLYKIKMKLYHQCSKSLAELCTDTREYWRIILHMFQILGNNFSSKTLSGSAIKPFPFMPHTEEIITCATRKQQQ